MSNPWNDIAAIDATIFAQMQGVESVTYEPTDGDSVTFDAQVFREEVQNTELGASLAIRVFVPRAYVETVSTSMDRVLIAKEVGGEPESCIVVKIINQDAGGFLLQLE